MNKRGLSAVVVTLIMILLGVVVAGVIWVVVQNVIETGTGQVELSTNCLAINMDISSAVCNQDGTSCNTTVERKAGGDDIGGIRVVYENAQESNPVDEDTSLGVNVKSTFEHSPEVANATSVKVIPYFLDESGNKQDCPEPVDVFNDVNIVS